MRVFISWSKEPSLAVAVALREWLPDVIQSVEPWMSSTDIRAGARWSAEITAILADAKIGIVCVTQDNQREPWLLFETGALAKTIEKTFVCPYLIHMPKGNLAQGPLTLFQAQLADRDGTWAVVTMVNEALGAEALPRERLQRAFDLNWPKLEAKLNALPPARAESHRAQEEVLAEILETVRSLARQSERPGVLDRAGQLKRRIELAEFSRRLAALRASGGVVGGQEKGSGREAAVHLSSYEEMLRQFRAAVELMGDSEEADLLRRYLEGASRVRRLPGGGGDEPVAEE